MMGKKSSRPSRELSKKLFKNKLVEGQVFNVTDEEYLNGYKVNPIGYICIDMELRKEYEDEFGIDSHVTGYDYYTHEEQIQTYSKKMLFCIKT